MRICKDMPIHSGIVLRMYPSNRQKEIIQKNAGASRFVYNRLVALNDERYYLAKTSEYVPAYQDRIDYINSILSNKEHSQVAMIKNSAPFLTEEDIDSQMIENAVSNYHAAWKQYMEHTSKGVPTFKRKGYDISYQTNSHYRKNASCINDSNVRIVDVHHVTLPKLGLIRVSGSEKRLKELLDRANTRIGTITIRKDSLDRYYVSFQLASETPFVDKLTKTGSGTSAVGIDLNIDNFLWDSNDCHVDNPKFRRSLQIQLAKAQRSMSRKACQAKKEGRSLLTSKNYQLDRKRVAALLSKISNRGENFRHEVSKQYVKNHDIIVAEDLNISNLLKNHLLAYAINECGWNDFLLKLGYKAKMYNKIFLKVPPQHTTQICSTCGYVLTGEEKLTLGDREWICPACRTYHVRDYNASINILAKGLALLGLAV